MATAYLEIGHGLRVSYDEEDAAFVTGRHWYLSKVQGPLRYAITSIGGGKRSMHRLLLKAKAGEFVDHIDGNGLNNTRENIRLCSHAENMRNRRMHKNNKTGAKGVYFDARRGVYRAQIRSDGRKYAIGSFGSLAEASAAYTDAAAALHGPFMRQPTDSSLVSGDEGLFFHKPTVSSICPEGVHNPVHEA